jgi:hypothetical protein
MARPNPFGAVGLEACAAAMTDQHGATHVAAAGGCTGHKVPHGAANRIFTDPRKQKKLKSLFSPGLDIRRIKSVHIGQAPEVNLVRINKIDAEMNRFGTSLGMIQRTAHETCSRFFHPFSPDQALGAGEVAIIERSMHADTVKMRFHGIES